MLIKAKKKN